MPCRWSRRCETAPVEALSMDDTEPKVQHWRINRRYNLMSMRRQVRSIVLFMALLEALRIGPVQIVFAGQGDFPARTENDFGIAYWMGYFMSWLYLCVFSVIFVPLFSWWIPNPAPGTRGHTAMQSVACYMKKLNMILLPLTVGLCLARYAYHLVHIFLYVDSAPATSRKVQVHKRSWVVRSFFVFGIAFMLSFGYYVFNLLEAMQLARVKPTEYLAIIMPVQVNLGILIGTLLQFRMEKRIAQKEALKAAAAKAEEGQADEKEALLDAE